MRWESWAQFWEMGGYAIYVWGSVGVTFALLAIEVWLARSAHQKTLAELAQLTLVSNEEWTK